MKGLPILLLAAASLGAPALAPVARAEVHVGVIGGANLTDLNVSDPEVAGLFDTMTAFAGGAVVEWGRGGRFFLRLEPMFVRKGTDLSIPPDDFLFQDGVSGSIRLDYLELPLLLRFGARGGRARPYLVAGPTAAYRIGAGAKANGEEADAEEIDESFEKGDFGVTAGAGLAFGDVERSFFLEARYTFGLSNIGKDTEDETVKNRDLRILAGVSFRLSGR